MGPEEQELLARHRESKDNKFRGKREDSTFEKQQVFISCGWDIDLRAECER